MTSISICFIAFKVNVKTVHKTQQAIRLDNILNAQHMDYLTLNSPCFLHTPQILCLNLFFCPNLCRLLRGILFLPI